MRLIDLGAQLYRYAGENSFSPVGSVDEADTVMFLCPKCFAVNGGPVGTHSIRVDFAGKGVPADVCIKNANGKPVWWKAAGTTVRNLSLTPSILLLNDCAWHGFVTRGAISNA